MSRNDKARARRQLGAVVLLEGRRLLRGRGGVGAVLLAGAPLWLMAAVVLIRREPLAPGRLEHDFAFIFQNLVLQMTLFFGCALVFGGSFRDEQAKKTLHHLLLVPLRRERLLLGKYLAALAVTASLFGGFTAAAYLTLVAGQGRQAALAHLGNGGLGHLLAYLLVVALACAAYGAVFVLFGLLARSPILPALVLWGWEHLNFLLPEALKRLGLVHYLLSLVPVTVPEGLLAILGEPLPVWVAVPVPLVLAAAVLAVSSRLVRRTEVDYGVE